MSRFHSHGLLTFVLTISVFGMSTILMLALNPPTFHYDTVWRKPVVGLILASICSAGILAASVPRNCLNLLDRHEAYSRTSLVIEKAETKVCLEGHHPDCGQFTDHIIFVDNTAVCAACLGLVIGASIALLGTTSYFFFGMGLLPTSFHIMLIGQIAVAMGLAQFKVKGYARLISNTLFVLGAFVIVIEIDKLTENILCGIYSEGVIVIWILTRTLLSQRDHWKICRDCMQPCQIAKAKKQRLVSPPSSVEGAYDNQ